jgi:Tfp pilus assembly protein PilE
MNNNDKKNNGFSLLELMIILAITAMIVQFAIPSYQVHIEKARNLQKQTEQMEETLKSFRENQK